MGSKTGNLFEALPWRARRRKRLDEQRRLVDEEHQIQSMQLSLQTRLAMTSEKETKLNRLSDKLKERAAQLDTRRKAWEEREKGSWQQRDYFAEAARAKIEGIPDARCFVLQNVIRSLRTIPGDVAECGVRYGKSSYFLLKADTKGRKFHLFDSFEGLSAPAQQDVLPEQEQAFWHANQLAVPEDEVRRNLSGFKTVSFYRGWIPDRFDEVRDRTFALVHVDVDLYEPTLASLRFFWPLLARNGMLVCDDYGSPRCPGAKQAFDEFFAELGMGFMELPTMQAIAIKMDASPERPT